MKWFGIIVALILMVSCTHMGRLSTHTVDLCKQNSVNHGETILNGQSVTVAVFENDEFKIALVIPNTTDVDAITFATDKIVSLDKVSSYIVCIMQKLTFNKDFIAKSMFSMGNLAKNENMALGYFTINNVDYSTLLIITDSVITYTIATVEKDSVKGNKQEVKTETEVKSEAKTI